MNFRISKLVENNQLLMIFSLLCSVILWLGVVSEDKESVDTVRNVPVEINITESGAGRLGLSPLLKDDIVIDVDVMGERAVVGNLSAEDIEIRAVLSSVTKPGTYQLRLEGYDYKRKGFDIINLKPATVEVRFDHIVSKKFPIEVELEGFSIPEGYIMNQEYVSPKEVLITGPSGELDKISRCVVKIGMDTPIKNTATFEREINILDASGEKVKSDFLEPDIKKTSVTVPVLKKKEVPVTIGFTNLPSGFDMESLHYTIAPQTLEIAGPAEMIDNLYEIHLGYIDMRELTPDMSVYYGAVLPTGYISVDNVQDVSVEFANQGYISKKYKVSDIRLINLPTDYNIVTNTKVIYDVEIYGPKADIDKITPQDILAEIDVSSIDIRVGQMVVPVKISIQNSQKSWAFGEYSAVITVKNK